MEIETPTSAIGIRLDILRLDAIKRLTVECGEQAKFTFVAAQFVPTDIILNAMIDNGFVENEEDIREFVTMALCDRLQKMMADNPYWPVDPEQLKHFKGLAVCGLFIAWGKGSRDEKGYGLTPVKHLDKTYYKVKLPIVKRAGGQRYWRNQAETLRGMGLPEAEVNKIIEKLKAEAGTAESVRKK